MEQKYSKAVEEKIGRVMGEFEAGKLTSGKYGPRVRSRKQTIAIALSEAREAGYKVPQQKPARIRSRVK